MLNPFFNLLAFAYAAPTVLRVVLGWIFMNLGWLKVTKERERWLLSFAGLHIHLKTPTLYTLAFLELVGGALLVVGFQTQTIAIMFSILTLVELVIERKDDVFLKRDFVFYLLVFAVSLSLVFTGAGMFALDLPL